MSMSTYVLGFVSPEDESYKKHSNVVIACVEAGISELPRETAEYFGCKYPDICLLEEKLEIEIPVNEWENDSASGLEIITAKIPNGVYKIRFVNNW